MSREIAAALLLLLLMAGAWWNISAVDRLSGDMLEQLELSRQAAEEGDASRALEELDPALERWLKADSYTHIFIRHSEIDSTAAAFYELRAALLAEELEGCDAAYGKLRYHIISIQEMEHPGLGSIL